jgi:DNA repair photolyase
LVFERKIKKIIIKEIKCKRALNPCKIKGFDYTLNPYIGCPHGCIYCYARFMCRYRTEKERWGEFVDVKVNIPKVLEEQVKHLKPGMVMLSSVTDAYQSLEKKYEITRKCLEILARNNFKIGLLTKSPLITRDIDVLKKFNDFDDKFSPGFTITCLDERDAKNFENNAPSVKSRLLALKKLNEAGISTFVFLGPFIPGISDKNMDELFKQFKEAGVKTILIDKLNLKCGNWPEIKRVLDKEYPELDKNYREKWLTDEYYEGIENKAIRLCGEHGFSLDLIFKH